MKIHAHYSQDGTIHGFILFDGLQGGIMLAPTPGVFVAEVQGLTSEIKSTDLEGLREIATHEKINIPMPQWTYRKPGKE